jgi:hypothetical protein
VTAVVERLPLVLTGVVVAGAGLAVRAYTGGAFAKYAGVALYACLMYVIVRLFAPRARPWVVALVALGACWAVEFAQLTPVPAALSARSALLRLAFGTTFSPADLLWYAVGVAAAFALHIVSRRR